MGYPAQLVYTTPTCIFFFPFKRRAQNGSGPRGPSNGITIRVKINISYSYTIIILLLIIIILILRFNKIVLRINTIVLRINTIVLRIQDLYINSLLR